MTKNRWKGKTALITGASSGIGESFARRLAGGGCNVVVTARRLEKLEALADELERETNICVTPVSCDLSVPGSAGELSDEIKARGISIDFLVNNAGIGLSGSFSGQDEDDIRGMIQLNTTSVVELTRRMIPEMLERNAGDILIVGSIAAYLPSPTLAVYSGTKAFVHSFGCALAYELRDTGVRVTVLNPGGTSTEWMEAAGFKSAQGPAVGMMSPDDVADAGLRAMAAGRYFTEPGFMNRLLGRAAPVVPMAAKLFFAHQVQKNIGGND